MISGLSATSEGTQHSGPRDSGSSEGPRTDVLEYAEELELKIVIPRNRIKNSE